MPLLRLIAIALIIWIGYVLIKNFLRKSKLQQNSKGAIPEQNPQQKMVRCEHCGSHLPLHLAFKKDSNHYYCPEHQPHD